MREGGFNVRLLSAGPFMTMMDRFAFAPVLIPIAVEFRAPVGAVAIAATAHYFAYGLAQPFWGFASDRAGRIKIIRISLGAAAAACALSALAPNLNFLIAARILAGASVCAVLPTALVYVGDMIPFKARHTVIADLLAAVAIGTSVVICAAVAAIKAGSINGSSPCTLTTVASATKPSARATSAIRSVPDVWSARVICTVTPCSRQAATISA